MAKSMKESQLLREWEQAWNHYRHLESSRSQYVGFFFTVLLATISIAIGFMKGITLDSKPIVIFGLIGLIFVDFFITISIFIIIKKTGYVLRRYEIIIETVREEFGVESSEKLPFDLADMKDYPSQVFDSKIFSVHRSTEIILGFSCFLFVALLITALLYLFISKIYFEWWQKAIGIGIVIIAMIYLFKVFKPLIIEILLQRRLRNQSLKIEGHK